MKKWLILIWLYIFNTAAIVAIVLLMIAIFYILLNVLVSRGVLKGWKPLLFLLAEEIQRAF